MINVQAVLFCGGKGSRLFPIGEYYQKVMIPIGKSGIPLLEIIIKHLSHHGIKKFLLLVNYRANQIRRYFGNGNQLGVNIAYSYDSPDLTGTGGALLNAEAKISDELLLIYYTDILSNINIEEFSRFQRHHDSIGSLWVDNKWTISEGVIVHDDSNLIQGIRHNIDEINASTGISLLKREILKIIKEVSKTKSSIDLSNDIFPKLVAQNELNAFLSEEWWLDVGSLSRYKNLDDAILTSRFPHLELGD